MAISFTLPIVFTNEIWSKIPPQSHMASVFFFCFFFSEPRDSHTANWKWTSDCGRKQYWAAAIIEISGKDIHAIIQHLCERLQTMALWSDWKTRPFSAAKISAVRTGHMEHTRVEAPSGYEVPKLFVTFISILKKETKLFVSFISYER